MSTEPSETPPRIGPSPGVRTGRTEANGLMSSVDVDRYEQIRRAAVINTERFLRGTAAPRAANPPRENDVEDEPRFPLPRMGILLIAVAVAALLGYLIVTSLFDFGTVPKAFVPNGPGHPRSVGPSQPG